MNNIGLIYTLKGRKSEFMNRNKCLDYIISVFNFFWISNKFMKNKMTIEEIEIETINRCNGICPFCPVNVNEPQREYAKMPDDLFKKIINDLKEMNYCGKLSLFSNNEPLLDGRIIDFYKYVHEELPNVKLSIYTNGSLLTLDKFLNLVDIVDELVIDNYNDEDLINKHLMSVYNEYSGNPNKYNNVFFSMRKQNEVLSSRGGQAPNKQTIHKVRHRCRLPYKQLVIRPTGLVSLCCNDPFGKYTLGDLKKQSISEVWNSDEYKKIRKIMFFNGRKALKLCNKCDTMCPPGKLVKYIRY